MNLMNILNSPIARAFSFLLFIGFCITIAYYKGYSTCERDVALKLQNATIEHNQKIIETERNLQNKQNQIVADYLQQISLLEAQHNEDKINLDNLRDAFDVKLDGMCNTNNSGSSTMSTKTGTQSNLKCYTRAELQRKIERSMAIVRECDQVALRYRSLLEWCKTYDSVQ